MESDKKSKQPCSNDLRGAMGVEGGRTKNGKSKSLRKFEKRHILARGIRTFQSEGTECAVSSF